MRKCRTRPSNAVGHPPASAASRPRRPPAIPLKMRTGPMPFRKPKNNRASSPSSTPTVRPPNRIARGGLSDLTGPATAVTAATLLRSARIIRRGSVDRWHLAAHRTKIRRELAAVVNGVEEHPPHEVLDRILPGG